MRPRLLRTAALAVPMGGFTTNTFAARNGALEVEVNGPGTPQQAQAFAVALVNTP